MTKYSVHEAVHEAFYLIACVFKAQTFKHIPDHGPNIITFEYNNLGGLSKLKAGRYFRELMFYNEEFDFKNVLSDFKVSCCERFEKAVDKSLLFSELSKIEEAGSIVLDLYNNHLTSGNVLVDNYLSEEKKMEGVDVETNDTWSFYSKHTAIIDVCRHPAGNLILKIIAGMERPDGSYITDNKNRYNPSLKFGTNNKELAQYVNSYVHFIKDLRLLSNPVEGETLTQSDWRNMLNPNKKAEEVTYLWSKVKDATTLTKNRQAAFVYLLAANSYLNFQQTKGGRWMQKKLRAFAKSMFGDELKSQFNQNREDVEAEILSMKKIFK